MFVSLSHRSVVLLLNSSLSVTDLVKLPHIQTCGIQEQIKTYSTLLNQWEMQPQYYSLWICHSSGSITQEAKIRLFGFFFFDRRQLPTNKWKTSIQLAQITTYEMDLRILLVFAFFILSGLEFLQFSFPDVNWLTHPTRFYLFIFERKDCQLIWSWMFGSGFQILPLVNKAHASTKQSLTKTVLNTSKNIA